MKKIYFKLNEKYKSFDKDFQTELEGDLIILSGTNGSGKSQIMNIINGKGDIDPTNGRKIEISGTVTVDGVLINYSNIEFKSFKDNINIPEVIKSSSALINTSVDQAYNYYKNYGLASSSTFNPQYKDSCDQVIKLLGALYNPNNKDITEDVFKKIIRDNKFIWKTDDQFTDSIGNLFYIHATEIANGQQIAGKVDGPAFDPLTIGLAPWTELNQLFEILKFNYRFKDSYEVEFAELTETPLLFQIDTHGKIIDTEVRNLKDLSDGEKTIISLCFTSLHKKDLEEKKLILLDEFDAVLNPSLIESFFIVIEKYFISKGIPVILTTHSSATISLAPENASFYEVFKKQDSLSRILKINKDDYFELQKVNKQFYDKIKNQANRTKELESTIESDENILIVTEGKTDWKYILKALEYFHKKGEFLEVSNDYFYRFGSKEDLEKKICGTNVVADLGESQLNSLLSSEINHRNGNPIKRKKILIGIFDSDTDIKIKEKSEYGVYSFKIEPSGISTEFLFEKEKIKAKINGERLFIGNEFDPRTNRHLTEKLNLGFGSSKRAGKIEIIDNDVYDETNINKALSKEKFAQAIFNGDIEITDKNWENFRHIFETILKFIPKEFLGNEKK